jgi:dienelactone hydrolase
MPLILPHIAFVLFFLLMPASAGEKKSNRETAPRPDTAFQTRGIENFLPVFSDSLVDQLHFPLSWLSGNFKDFRAWRESARKRVLERLLKAPCAAAFDPVVGGEQDRGKYTAQKVVFNITAESRVLGFLLIPKGTGPFPAVLLLHDHGSRFDIGKEKVIEPWDDTPGRIASAREWIDRSYGGRFIGDELASRGYICFATDALNWSDRGGAGYEGQQALASNLFNLGTSFAGLIAWEDLRAAEFLATLPGVDSCRVTAMGFSMGAFRAWQVAALSDHIAGAVAICWMATHQGLMVPGNNLVRGQSAFTTTHPGLCNDLDYADVASLACPKPMLFYGGAHDKLFPVASVQDAYGKMRAVWDSQHAGDRLVTKVWNCGHIFNREMQDEAFEWLDSCFQSSKSVPAGQPTRQ